MGGGHVHEAVQRAEVVTLACRNRSRVPALIRSAEARDLRPSCGSSAWMWRCSRRPTVDARDSRGDSMLRTRAQALQFLEHLNVGYVLQATRALRFDQVCD